MAEQQAVVALVYDARGAQKGAADTVAAAEKILAATRPLAKVFSPIADEADKATRRIVKSTSDQTRALDALVKKFDPLGESARRAQRDVDMLSRALAQGGDAATRAASVWEAAQRRRDAALRAMSGGGGSGSGGMQQAAADTDRASASFGGFATKALAVGAALYAAKQSIEGFVGGIARASDQVNQLEARLNVLTGSAQGSRDTFNQVYQIAQRTGVALNDVGGAYSRMAIAAGEFGATNQQVAVVVDTLTKLGRVAGGTTAEVSAGIQQLGQALASGVLQGDELRSIRENLPLVAKAIAKEFGVSIGELKRLGEEGRLTADRVFAALQKANKEATAQFQQMPATVEQAATRSANAMTAVTAEFGKWTGLADFFVNKLNQAAGILEIIGRGIGVLNNPEFQDRSQLSTIDRELGNLRARQGQPRSLFGDLFGGSPAEINERIAALEARRRAIESRQADRAYDAGIAANNQTFGDMEKAAAATAQRRTASMVEVDKLRASYDPLIKLQRDLAEAQKHYDAAVASGAITQAHANEELAKYKQHLIASSGASREAAAEAKRLAEEKKRAIEGFAEGTREIERENKLLQLQIDLTGQRPEIVEREIALLRVKNELEAKGLKATEVDVKARTEALVTSQRLNREMDEARRAAELWAEPFKNAIQGIQSTFTDFFERIFSGGIRSFADLAESIKRIWFRLMAEMAAVAVVRPVIQFVGGSLGQLGILGPQTLQSMGITGGGVSSGGGGFNPFGMFGSGGFDGMLGRVGSFLSSPISGFPSAGAFEGVIPGMSGSAAQQYFNGASGGGLFGTTTWGQGLGALAGVGSSIFSFASGNPIGGVAGLLGAGASLIPGIGQVAGPVIGILGSILGGLFKKEPNYAAQGFHSYNPATGRYGARVGFEENMKAPLAPGIGNDALKLISAFGGSVAPGMSAPEYYIWRGFKDGRMDATVTAEGSPTYRALLDKVWASGQIKTTDEAQWAARTELWTDSPVNGEWTPLPINSLTGDSDKLMQQLALLILKAGVRDGVFTGLTETSQKIIRNYPDADTKGLGEALQWGKSTYDILMRGDTITAAEKAITDLKDSFQAAIMKAEEYRLATDGLVAAQSRAVKKYATDFNQNIGDRILGITDPAALQRLQLDREFEQLRKEAEYLNSEAVYSLTGTLVDINELERLYGLQREQIVSQQLDGLIALQKRLLFGDLSGATPEATVAGTQATFRSTLAQAMAGSGLALGNLAGAGADYVSSLQSAYGNTAQFASGRDEVLRAIEMLTGSGGATGGIAANLNGGVSTEDRILIQGLFARVDQQAEQIASLIAELRRAA